MEKKIYIAGAHSRGQTLKEYLTFLEPETVVESYLVDDLEDNRSVIDGIPVRLIEDNIVESYPVYIATRGVNHEKIKKELEAVGMTTIIPVTVELDRELRNAYVQKVYEQQGKEFILVNQLEKDGQRREEKSQDKVAGRIYVANSIYDKALSEQYRPLAEEKTIQVGAALTSERIENALEDSKGDNISDRNKQFCELTALYWIWKHANEDYIGLVHYRRHFLLPEDWLKKIQQNDVDVVLPVPLYVGPSLEENYKERHVASDWEFLMQYMKNNLPGDYIMAEKFFKSNLYSPCNMFIMKREVLNDLGNWLFPILDAVVKNGGIKEETYQNRYPGFMSERLITYFFETKRDKYKLVYADKNFLS